MILHHYAMSPFSEKVRALLGSADIAWQSCLTRELPPRPVLAALAGGYRKVPVAQVGADIFCDTQLIASEIALISGNPALAPEHADAAGQAFAAHADLAVFLDALAAAMTVTLAGKMLRAMPLRDVAGFFVDRVRIGRTARVRAGNPLQAKARLRAHLADLEARLQQHSHLFGDAPCHADFSAYHSLWFIRDLGESSLVAGYPRVMAWMDRLQAAGQGQRTEITAEVALAAARDSQPRAIPPEQQQDARLGRWVEVAPADYATDATRGRLVGVTPSRWILARDTPDLGTLHVHFPQAGFRLTEV